VLLKPPMQFNTLLLWFGPALILMLAGFAAYQFLRRQDGMPTEGTEAAPSAVDEARLAELLDGTTDRK
jgi:cytochrome c-type biogenesis protein CcmH